MAENDVNYEIEVYFIALHERAVVGGCTFADGTSDLEDVQRDPGTGTLGNPETDRFRVYVRDVGHRRRDGIERGYGK